MDLEQKIIEAILADLKNQAEAGGRLKVGENRQGVVTIDGAVNLEELAMAIAGAVAGGP